MDVKRNGLGNNNYKVKVVFITCGLKYLIWIS